MHFFKCLSSFFFAVKNVPHVIALDSSTIADGPFFSTAVPSGNVKLSPLVIVSEDFSFTESSLDCVEAIVCLNCLTLFLLLLLLFVLRFILAFRFPFFVSRDQGTGVFFLESQFWDSKRGKGKSPW